MDRDLRCRQSYEESPPDGHTRVTTVAPAPGFDSLPHLALPHNDGDAVEAIRSIVGCPDGTGPEEWYTAPDAVSTKMVFTTAVISVPRLG